MSRFLAANTKYHKTHKTKGSEKQISEAISAAARQNPDLRAGEKRISAFIDYAKTRVEIDREAKGHVKLRNPETGLDEWFRTQADADRSAKWFHLFEQDKRIGIAREQMKLDAKREMDEAVKIQKLRAAVPLIIERKMVGVLAALEGIRCYHYDKTSDTGMTECDCTKVSPGVFVVAAHHQPGTFYLDDSKVKRQIAVMEANQALSGHSNVMNPGGFGQPISEKNHIQMATIARVITQQSGMMPNDC
jgi:hypothetical protein